MKSDRLDLIPGPYLIHPACGVIELRQGAELPLAERTLPHWWNQMSDNAQDIAFEESGGTPSSHGSLGRIPRQLDSRMPTSREESSLRRRSNCVSREGIPTRGTMVI